MAFDKGCPEELRVHRLRIFPDHDGFVLRHEAIRVHDVHQAEARALPRRTFRGCLAAITQVDKPKDVLMVLIRMLQTLFAGVGDSGLLLEE